LPHATSSSLCPCKKSKVSICTCSFSSRFSMPPQALPMFHFCSFETEVQDMQLCEKIYILVRLCYVLKFFYTPCPYQCSSFCHRGGSEVWTLMSLCHKVLFAVAMCDFFSCVGFRLWPNMGKVRKLYASMPAWATSIFMLLRMEWCSSGFLA
jgi:hypothetical protein